MARGVKVMRVNSRVVRFWSGLTCLSNQGEELAVRFEVEKRENHYHSTGYLGTVPTAPVSIMPLFNRNPLYQDLSTATKGIIIIAHRILAPSPSSSPVLYVCSSNTGRVSRLNAQTGNPASGTP